MAQPFAIHTRMLLPLFFLVTSLFGFYFSPLTHLATIGQPLHQHCLDIVPNSVFRSEYQTLLCGERLTSDLALVQNSGLTHWLLIYGFQIYIIHLLSKWLFSRTSFQNIFCIVAVFLVLMVTAFHPSSVRAAIGLLLKQTSFQKKLFWSPLQMASFSGFISMSLCPAWMQSRSLLICWTAAMIFGFFQKSRLWVKMIATPIVILPFFSNLALPHPFLTFIFSIASRPALYFLFPLSLLGCFESHFLIVSDFFLKNIFLVAQNSVAIFRPSELNLEFSVVQLWVYFLILMTTLLFLENKRLRDL